MISDSMMPQVPSETNRTQDTVRLPTTSVGHHGIHLTLTRSSSKDLGSTVGTNNLISSNTEQQQTSRIINGGSLNSLDSTTNLQNPQKITVTSGQQRQGVSFVRLNQPGVQHMPPVQRIVLRDTQQRPETPDRIVTHRFGVKSVDRQRQTTAVVTSNKTHQYIPIEPFRVQTFSLNEMITQQLELATLRFNERVADQSLKSSHELNKLEHRLKKTEAQLTSKCEELVKLKGSFEQSLREQASQQKSLMDKTLAEVYRHEKSKLQSINVHTKLEIDKNFEYLTGKMRDLENKVRVVVDSHEVYTQSLKGQNDQIMSMKGKMQDIRMDLVNISQQHVQVLKKMIETSINERESRLQALEVELSRVKASHSSTQNILTSNNQKYNLMIGELKRLLRQTSDKVTKSWGNIEFNLDLRCLSPVQETIGSLKSKVDEFERKSSLQVETMTKLFKEYNNSVTTAATKHSLDDKSLREMQVAISELTRELQTSEKRNEGLQNELGIITASNESLKAKNEQLSIILRKTTSKLESTLAESKKLEPRCLESQQQLDNLSKLLKEAESKIVQLQSRNKQLQAYGRRTSTCVDESTRKYEQLKTNVKAKFQEISKQHQNSVLSLKLTIEKLQKSNRQLNEKINELQTKLANEETHMKQIEQKNKSLSINNQKLQRVNQLHLTQQLNQMVPQVANKRNGYNSIPLSKTQSIRFEEQVSNMNASKVSFKSEQRMQKSKGHSKKQGSDEESNSSNFYYRQSSIKSIEAEPVKSQSSLQSKRKEDLPLKLAKLKEILKISRKPLPLSCEIDQTGYLKDTEEGTYIYDTDGNLFVLTTEELSKAISHRIISL